MSRKATEKKMTENEKRERNRILKKEYELNKRKLLLVERNNYGHVFLLKTQDGWWKVFSHSALMFTHYVRPIVVDKSKGEIDVPVVKADLDFHDRAPIGVMFFPTLKAAEKILLLSGAVKVDCPKTLDSEWVTCYKLDREMLESEFWDMKRREDELWDKANTIVTPEAVFPNLGVDLRETAKMLFDNVRKYDSATRELIGRHMIELIRRVMTGLISAEKGLVSWEKFFNFAPKLLSELDACLMVLTSVRTVEKNVIFRMAESISRVEKDISEAMRTYENKKG